MPATGESGGGHVSKGQLSPTISNQWGKSFYRQKEGAPCRNSTVSSVIFKLVTGGLTSVILVVLGAVNL